MDGWTISSTATSPETLRRDDATFTLPGKNDLQWKTSCSWRREHGLLARESMMNFPNHPAILSSLHLFLALLLPHLVEGLIAKGVSAQPWRTRRFTRVAAGASYPYCEASLAVMACHGQDGRRASNATRIAITRVVCCRVVKP